MPSILPFPLNTTAVLKHAPLFVFSQIGAMIVTLSFRASALITMVVLSGIGSQYFLAFVSGLCGKYGVAKSSGRQIISASFFAALRISISALWSAASFDRGTFI